MDAQFAITDRELRVKRHVAYTYLLKNCLRRDEQTGLYLCPSRLAMLVMMPMVEDLFGYDLRGVPGFYYAPSRDVRRELALMCGIDDYPESGMGGWMVNLPTKGFVMSVTDERGRITELHVFKNSHDTRPGLLTSKGLPLGS